MERVTLDEEAKAAGIDLTSLLFKDVGHKYSSEYYPQIRDWLQEKAAGL